MRLYGIDRRYSSDTLYIVFLYQVKEALEIKRSRVTFFRKSKVKYTRDKILSLHKTELERSDLGFKAFKTIRGTTPYFQAEQRELFSMIRQLGPPHIFFPKSVNETGMIHLIKALKQKDENRIISYTDVIMMSKSQRTKLIKKYPIDVVQHLDCVFRHHINTMKKQMSLGEYHIEDYFYCVEFQQRGSAHI